MNFFGWIFALSSIIFIPSNVLVDMYALFHQDTYIPKAWHVYIAFTLVNVLCLAIIILKNQWLPLIQKLGSVAVVGGGIITIIVNEPHHFLAKFYLSCLDPCCRTAPPCVCSVRLYNMEESDWMALWCGVFHRHAQRRVHHWYPRCCYTHC